MMNPGWYIMDLNLKTIVSTNNKQLALACAVFTQYIVVDNSLGVRLAYDHPFTLHEYTIRQINTIEEI